MSKFLTPSQQELLSVLSEANEISTRSEVTKRDEVRMSFLLAKMKALTAGNTTGKQSEECRQFFSDLLKGREVRTTYMEAGAQTPTYTVGQLGGYLVPQEFHNELIVGMAQFDPLLNKDVVTLIESGDGGLRPYSIPGWDLSTFKAVKVAEGVQQTPQTPPTASTKILNGYKYMCSLPVSTELEEDSFMTAQMLMQQAFSIGFGRGIGIDLVLGDGSTGPQGVLNGATPANPSVLAGLGVVTEDDINNIYFSVNRFHRANPKCAWLMNDASYEMVRKAKDTSGRPLLSMSKDIEVLMGKPVLVSPSMPIYNASLGSQSNGSFCAFGNLSQLLVRVSRAVVKRNSQAAGYVERGVALYTGIIRADAKILDPTGGTVPPIVYANLHE